jgi:ferritin-like metal-binding protein YciE
MTKTDWLIPGDLQCIPLIFLLHHKQKEIEMAEKTLQDLFLDTVKDIYFAERQILKALPKMSRAAQSEELKAAFNKHREETEVHIERLQEVFELLGKPARGKTCEAIQGIIAEGEEIIEDFKGSPALDAGLISSAQAVEHYEITRYGTLKTWATQLGMKEAAKLFEKTLGEESATDEALSSLALASVNVKAKTKAA